MLRRLLIKNIAIIEQIEFDLEKGLNILTGETGAGKSIIIDAVNFVLGERASRDLVKFGSEKAQVEAVFDIDNSSETTSMLKSLELNGDSDTELFLYRELSNSGRSICRINGILVPLNTLKTVADMLVDIHGQHEHQSLLQPASHIKLLDAFAKEKIYPLKHEIQNIYDEYKLLSDKLKTGFLSEAERARRTDILNYQINEIASANLYLNEEEELNGERRILMNAERIMAAFETSYECVSGTGSSLSQLKSASKSIDDISSYSPEYQELSKQLNDVYYRLEDISFTLRDLKSAFEYDPKRLDSVEKRLDFIASLKRKYGQSIEAVLFYKDSIEKELIDLIDSADLGGKLERELNACKNNYFSIAQKLSELRKTAAGALKNEIASHLSELGLKKTKFEVQFTKPNESKLSRDGLDNIEFMLSTNPGEPVKSLNKVASGGEMSRIMLAIKAVTADIDNTPTMIFDEIDSGISGNAATIVGEKMAAISSARQVICITHLPQIAAMADTHFLVEKEEDANSTRTKITRLDFEQRCREIAKIIDGAHASTLSVEHARELLFNAESAKKTLRNKFSD